MEKNSHIFHTLISLALVITTLMVIIGARLADIQTSSACTGPMIRSFGSCIHFLTSGSNLFRPSSACCNSLRDLMSNGQDCLCLIVTRGVSFQVPINIDIVISLPHACRMFGVPIECKAPFLPQPFTPPGAGMTSSLVREGDLVPTLTPPGMQLTLIPSAAQPCHKASPSLLVALMGVILMIKYY